MSASDVKSKLHEAIVCAAAFGPLTEPMQDFLKEILNKVPTAAARQLWDRYGSSD